MAQDHRDLRVWEAVNEGDPRTRHQDGEGGYPRT